MAIRAFAISAVLLCEALLTGGVVAQEVVGEVTYVQGITSAQRSGQETRFLAQGDKIIKGEVLSTSERGYAVLGLADGSRFTLRSNTAFVIQELDQSRGRETLLMGLLRGGLRAFSGAIGKVRGSQVRLSTPTATIGIRGTEFDARLCAADCRREAQFAQPGPRVAAEDRVAARAVAVSGEASAVGRDGGARLLAQGGAVFDGESVRTGAGAFAVLAFRDQTRITVIESSSIKLDNVRFADAPADGNFAVRLLAGGLRAFSGLIAKANRGRVRFVTPTATIGIRGTGLDIRDAPDGVYLHVWDGAGALEFNGSEVVVERDRAGMHARGRPGPELLESVPQFFRDEPAPRPDRVDVDFERLFATRRQDDVLPGLYVGVRGGGVELAARGGTIDLGPLEAGFLAEGGDDPQRIEPLPGFLFNDTNPLPDTPELRPLRLIELLGPGRLSASDQCLLQ